MTYDVKVKNKYINKLFLGNQKIFFWVDISILHFIDRTPWLSSGTKLIAQVWCQRLWICRKIMKNVYCLGPQISNKIMQCTLTPRPKSWDNLFSTNGFHNLKPNNFTDSTDNSKELEGILGRGRFGPLNGFRSHSLVLNTGISWTCVHLYGVCLYGLILMMQWPVIYGTTLQSIANQ